jgi:hypothetical protein
MPLPSKVTIVRATPWSLPHPTKGRFRLVIVLEEYSDRSQYVICKHFARPDGTRRLRPWHYMGNHLEHVEPIFANYRTHLARKYPVLCGIFA